MAKLFSKNKSPIKLLNTIEQILSITEIKNDSEKNGRFITKFVETYREAINTEFNTSLLSKLSFILENASEDIYKPLLPSIINDIMKYYENTPSNQKLQFINEILSSMYLIINNVASEEQYSKFLHTILVEILNDSKKDKELYKATLADIQDRLKSLLLLKPDPNNIILYQFILQHCEDDGSILNYTDIDEINSCLGGISNWGDCYYELYCGLSRLREDHTV